MKKTYINPEVLVVKMKYTTALMSYSMSQADKDAVTLGREDSYDWEDE